MACRRAVGVLLVTANLLLGAATPTLAARPTTSPERTVPGAPGAGRILPGDAGVGEAGLHLGTTVGDPFVQHVLVGGSVAYHPSRVVWLQLDASYAPNLGTSFYKPLTTQLIEVNAVDPDLTRMVVDVAGSVAFAPVRGHFALKEGASYPFDVYGLVGMGAVRTHDDLDALRCSGVGPCALTANQVHTTTSLAVGARLGIGRGCALRLELRNRTWVEAVDGTTLGLEHTLALQTGLSTGF